VSLGEEISKIVEEEADHLPKDVEAHVLVKQKGGTNHVTILGVHPDLESAQSHATARLRKTEHHETTVLEWTEEKEGIHVSQHINIGDGRIKYVILASRFYPAQHFQEEA
jgi:hypothetical protein